MKTILTIVLLSAEVIAHSQDRSALASRQVVFKDVNVITMDGNRVEEHQTVIARNGRIIAVGDAGEVKNEPGALVISAHGKYLIPGLAEMHAHVPPSDDIESMKDVLKLFAFNGITTIRGMLGHPRHLELRESIRKGEIFGPHFYTTGPSFNGLSIRSPEEGAALVRRQKEAGYDYLKLHPGLTRQKFDAIASTAKEVGIPFAGHVSFGVGVWRAIEAGYSSIDHLDGFVEGLVPGIEKMHEQQAGLFGMLVADEVDRSRIPELMKALRENNIWVVPTQSLAERWFNPDYTAEDFLRDPHMIYMKPQTTEQWIRSKKNLVNSEQYNEQELRNFVQLRRDLIMECQKNGVGLLLGCDAPQIFNVPGFSTHNELEYLVLSGLSPYEALLSGTRNVAAYLGHADAGVIREGAVSDLILLDANPLDDIRNTRKIAGVMIGNQWMDKSYIDTELKKLVKN
jgi:imidazolonepropionase-like amidohydrolase